MVHRSKRGRISNGGPRKKSMSCMAARAQKVTCSPSGLESSSQPSIQSRSRHLRQPSICPAHRSVVTASHHQWLSEIPATARYSSFVFVVSFAIALCNKYASKMYPAFMIKQQNFTCATSSSKDAYSSSAPCTETSNIRVSNNKRRPKHSRSRSTSKAQM